MKNNTIFIYWSDQAKNVYDCALIASNLMREITLFSGNQQIGIYGDKFYNETSFESIFELLIRLFKKDVRKYYKLKDIPDDLIIGSGSSISFLNDEITYKLTVGTDSKVLTNCLIISLSDKYQKKAKNFFTHLISYVKPDWGLVCQEEFLYKIHEIPIKTYPFGWMTYFSKDITDKIILELNKPTQSFLTIFFNSTTKSNFKDFLVELFAEENLNDGRLLITVDEIFDSNNHEHIRKAMACVNFFRERKIKR